MSDARAPTASPGPQYDGVELSSSALRALGPFVRLDRIQPGDVMLVCGTGLQSEATARLSGGVFSHAAMWLPISGTNLADTYRWSSLQLVESDPHGVGPTFPETIQLREDTRWTPLACFPGTTRLHVVRHPSFAALDRDRVHDAADHIRRTEFYRSYSPYSRLVEASVLPPWLRPAATLAMARLDHRELHLPGAFCSELIAKFFDELDLPLFESRPTPASISPSRLSDNDCRLTAASPSVVLFPQDIADDLRGWRSGIAAPRGRAVDLAPLVEQSERTAKTSAAVASVTQRARDQLSEQLAQSRATDALRLEQLEKALREKRPFETPSLRDTLLRLFAQAHFLRALDATISPLESEMRHPPALRQALNTLRSTHIHLTRQLAIEVVHHDVVYALRAIGAAAGRRNRARRRAVLDSWREYRDYLRQSTPVFRSLNQLAAGDVELLATPECQAHVSRLMAIALEQARLHQHHGRIAPDELGTDLIPTRSSPAASR